MREDRPETCTRRSMLAGTAMFTLGGVAGCARIGYPWTTLPDHMECTTCHDDHTKEPG